MRMWMSKVVVGLVVGAVAHGGLSPEAIVEKADSIRNPDESFFMKVQVASGGDDTRLFEVSLKGNDKTYIRTLEPKRDVGRDMLMLEENMWAFVPNLKRAVRVSLSQKLTGEAANGDLSRTRWAGDYEAKIEKEDKGSWTLLLSARKKGLTYEKIRAFIEKKTFRPLRAEYLTGDGKVIKRVAFQDYKKLAGETRPTLLVIEDAVRTSKRSEIRILDMRVKAFNDSVFSLERFNAR